MFTDVTFQDWLDTPEMMRDKLLLDIVGKYKASPQFVRGLEANAYFSGRNTHVMEKKILKADVLTKVDHNGREKKFAGHREVVGNQIADGFFRRFVAQQNQYLLSYGVTLDKGVHDKLGADFDSLMQELGEGALLHGVGWCFWNADHVEIISAARDAYSGFVPLLDEITGEPMVGVQFWQLDNNRPLCIRLFEQDGVTVFRKGKQGLQIYEPKRAYKVQVVRDALGEQVVGMSNYGMLPVVPLFANHEQQSELTDGLKAKIDAYDNIISDLADNLDRANDVYWVLNNYGGCTDDVLAMLEKIQQIKAVVTQTDGMGGNATAEPKTIEVPYQARSAALELLKKGLYQDYGAMDMDEITGGSLTNVAIKVAAAGMNLKADRYEWQCASFMRRLLNLLGLESKQIAFKRSAISNDSEMVQSIYTMREDIDLQTALSLNPYILDEQIPQIMQRVDAEQQTGRTNVRQLENELDE